MKINWKLRLKNKIVFVAIISWGLNVIYPLCKYFNIELPITQSALFDLLNGFVEILMLLGIIVDPTTEGINDSKRALSKGELYE